MRISTPIIAVVALVVSVVAGVPGRAVAQDSTVIDGDITGGPGACGCRDLRSPPWHGTVAGAAGGPCCPPPTMFHADPCGQLWQKHTAHLQGCTLPPCFPRMHGRLTTGWWPTPRPIVTPRCPRCGAHIEQGF